MRVPDVFDYYDAEEEGPERERELQCRRCGSTDVRWRQQGGKWVLFSLQPGVVHTCELKTDDFPNLEWPMTRRHANVNWKLPEAPSGALVSWEEVNRALLMDLRDGLNRLDVAIDLQNCYAKQILTVLKRMDRRMQVSMPLRRKP